MSLSDILIYYSDIVIGICGFAALVSFFGNLASAIQRKRESHHNRPQ